MTFSFLSSSSTACLFGEGTSQNVTRHRHHDSQSQIDRTNGRSDYLSGTNGNSFDCNIVLRNPLEELKD